MALANFTRVMGEMGKTISPGGATIPLHPLPGVAFKNAVSRFIHHLKDGGFHVPVRF